MTTKSWEEYEKIGIRLVELLEESNLRIKTSLFVRQGAILVISYDSYQMGRIIYIKYDITP